MPDASPPALRVALALAALLLAVFTPPRAPAAPDEETPEASSPKAVDDLSVEALITEIPDINEGKNRVEMTLESAIRMALRNNYDQRIQAIDREIVLRNILIEKAVFDPYFNLGYSFNKNRDATASSLNLDPLNPVIGVEVNPFNFNTYFASITGDTILGTNYSLAYEGSRADNPEASFFSLNPRYSSQLRAQITQPILKNGWYDYNSSSLRLARNDAEISRHQFLQVLTDTIYQVTLAYWELVFAHKNFQARRNALELAQEQLRLEGQKLRFGTVAPVDLITSKSQLARRKTEFDTAWQTLEKARDDLLRQVNFSGSRTLRAAWEMDGLDLYGSLVVIPVTEPDGDPRSPERDRSLESAFRRRPDFLQAELEITRERINLARARNQLLPQLDFTGSWSQIGLEQNLHDSWDGIEEGRFYNWSAGLNLSVPLTYRGLIAGYRNARSQLERSLQSRSRLENEVVIEVDQAIRDLAHAHRAVTNLNQLVRLQEVLLAAEKRKLEVGTSIAYTVTQIENDLVDIQAEELRAQADFENAKAKYRMAVGELLDGLPLVVE